MAQQLTKNEVRFLKGANLYTKAFSYRDYRTLKARRRDDGAITYRVPMWDVADVLFVFGGGDSNRVTICEDARQPKVGRVVTLDQFIKEVRAYA